MLGVTRGSKKKKSGKAKKVVIYEPEQLAQLLVQLADQSTIKAAEKALKPFLNGGECIPRLLQQVSENPDGVSKLHAAMLVKRHLAVHYQTYPVEAKQAVKSQILQIVQTEQQRNVAHHIASAVTTILTLSVKDEVIVESWDELFPTIFQMASNENEILCARAYILLQNVSPFLEISLPFKAINKILTFLFCFHLFLLLHFSTRYARFARSW